MKITISEDLSSVNIQLDLSRKDLDVFENEFAKVIVYGYPYFTEKNRWCSAEEALRHYYINSEQFTNEIDGIYSIIFIDKSAKAFKVITDRYGIYTLFYTFPSPKEIVIADNLKELATIFQEIEINKESLIEYLNFGIKLGNKTHLKRVEKLEGASVYSIDNNLEINKKKYWELLEIDNSARMSNDEFHDVFNQHFERACQLGNNISIPLTGGRDSRAILSACLSHKEKLTSYTHGPHYHTDVKQARTISRYFDVPHKHYKIGNKFGKKLLKKAENNADIFDGHYSFIDYLHVKQSFDKESIKADLFLTGILGNQLYRHHPIGNFLPENLTKEEIVEHIIKQIPSVFFFRTNLLDFYDQLFTEIDKDGLNKLIIKSVMDVLNQTDHAESPLDYTRHFLFKTYCSNSATNTLRFTGKYFKVFGAFFHKDLLKQFKFFTLKDMINANLHNYIIDKNSKYLSELNYYNSGRIVKYLKLISNKVSGKFLKTTIFRHPDLTNYHFWIKKYHKQFLLDLLDYDNMKLAPLFNKSGLKEILDIYLNSKFFITSKKKLLLSFSIERFIINLVSLELWLKDLSQNKPIRFV